VRDHLHRLVPDHDVDYLYGQVSIDTAFVDWSGNCGNLSTAVGPFAIANGLIDPARVPRDGLCTVRIWQANIGKTIIAHVPMRDGEVQEIGDFELDGVTFPAAEIQLEFIDPSDDGDAGAMFPTGNLVDTWTCRASAFRGDHDPPASRPSSSMRPTWATPAPSCSLRSTRTRRRWSASRRSAPTAPCAWV
jgi:hypothetical protein